jgi:hypothetical protein
MVSIISRLTINERWTHMNFCSVSFVSGSFYELKFGRFVHSWVKKIPVKTYRDSEEVIFFTIEPFLMSFQFSVHQEYPSQV